MEVETYLNRNPDIKIINQSSSSILEHEKPPEELEAIKNRGNFLLRQELKDKTPLNTPNCIISYHIICIIIFSTISTIILSTNSKKNFKEVEYTHCLLNTKCNITFQINKNLDSPIYLYYKLDNFYSNHIDFVKSKNYYQLRGENVSEKKIDASCKYMSRNKDHFRTNNESEIMSYYNEVMDPNSLMNPCGLIADSMFNDSFTLYDSNNHIINIDPSNITYEMDRNKNFKNDKNYKNTQWHNKEDEHFIVWMNMELFPNFIKKWGNINQDLPKGEYKMTIDNKWGKAQWNIKKYFILAKGNKFGSETFFGFILIIACGIEVVFIIIIYISKFKKNKFNPEEMKWD